jgi:hypothetical protein
MTLPTDVKQVFFETIEGDKSVLEFERWLYANTDLEKVLDSTSYLELISIGYNNSAAKYELKILLEQLIDTGEYETWRLVRMLTQALQRDQNLPNLLMAFYDLHWHGYTFLEDLGLRYGLTVEVPYSDSTCWNDLSAEQQQKLLAGFYPHLNSDLKTVLDWLDSGNIVLTGNKDQYGHYVDYLDNRTVEEKKSTPC